MTKKNALLVATCFAAALLWSFPALATPASLSMDAAVVPAIEESPSTVENAEAQKLEGADCGGAAVPTLPAFLSDVETTNVLAGGEASWGGGSNCVGTLNYFIAPACQACNINRFDCESACSSRGGVDYFSCNSGGLECHCNDGAYDSCGCGW